MDPFATDEAKEAFKTACRSALEANHLLLGFLHLAMSAGEAATPLAVLQEAAAMAKEAEAAWALFGRLSSPKGDNTRTLN